MRQHGEARPGAAEAISMFVEEDFVQSVVTGNIRSIAIARKLEAFGLHQHIDFAVGGYGDDGSDRAELVRLAVERAEATYRRGFKAEQTIVIGDTPHDIWGALDNGALAVGVAMGSSSVEELAAAGADIVLTSLEDRTPLRDAIRHRHTR